MKNILLKSWPHAMSILIFVILASAFFSPAFDDFDLAQHDIEGWTGMSKEANDYRLLNNEEALWTNAMFCGMPVQLISIVYPSNWFVPLDKIMKLGLPRPVGGLFMAMLGFYILCLCLGARWWIALLGAIGFGFTTFHILFLGAGHTSKISAVGYMAPALGGVLLAYRRNAMLGAAVFAVFFGLHIASNHLQMTYYFAMLLGAVLVGELVRSVLEKQIGFFIKSSAFLVLGLMLAILPNAGGLIGTYEYSKYSMRGDAVVSIAPEGQEETNTGKSGLDRDYILQYSFGKGEVWSLLFPDVKGGKSGRIGSDKKLLKTVEEEYKEAVGNSNQYWGEQMGTGGAFYFGAIIMFLFFLGIIFVKDIIKWPLLVIALLTLFLCQKDNSLNNWFIDHFPMYNKFRDTKMILVLFALIAPLMATLFLDWFGKVPDTKKLTKWMSSAIGGFLLVLIIFYATPQSFFDFQSANEKLEFADYMDKLEPGSKELSFVEGILENLDAVRIQIFQADLLRTLIFVLFAAVLIVLVMLHKVRLAWVTPVLVIMVLADLWTVDRRYLDNEKMRGNYRSYVRHDEKVMPYHPSFADQFILETEKGNSPQFEETKSKLLAAMNSSSQYKGIRNKNLMDSIASFGALHLTTNYRVLTLQGTFADASASYFHKTIGGYHAAKLRRFQDIVNFHLGNEMQTMLDSLKANKIGVLSALPVLNMLNTKYILYNPDSPPLKNDFACGNAWFVNQMNIVKNTDEEIVSLSEIDPKKELVVTEAFSKSLAPGSNTDSLSVITLEEYGTRYLKYNSKNNFEANAVFSEIYYPEGWTCTIDDNPVEFACVNYILRGVKIPAGEHIIEWTFEPRSYATGNKVGYAGTASLSIFLLLVVFMEYRKSKSPLKGAS